MSEKLRRCRTPSARCGTRGPVSASGIAITDNTWILPKDGAVAGFSFEKSSVGDVVIRGNRVK